jgi:glycosyltransferase involved in cell wall biosynthesis
MLNNLSVIIPIRNMEYEITNLLDEISYLTSKETQVILVDDGSTDSTFEILQDLKLKLSNSENLNIVSQSHQGPGNARNSGFALANREYVAFWDSDDLRFLHNFEKLFQSGFKEDMLVADYVEKYELVNKLFKVKRNLSNLNSLVSDGGLWRIVFKRNFILEIRFPSTYSGEDLTFLARCILLDPSIAWSNLVIYEYNNKRVDQITKNKKYLESTIESCLLLLTEISVLPNKKNVRQAGVIAIKLIKTSIQTSKMDNTKIIYKFLVKTGIYEVFRLFINLTISLLILIFSRR